MGGDHLIRILPGGHRIGAELGDRLVIAALDEAQIDPETVGDAQIPVVEGVAHHVSGQLLRVDEADGGIIAEHGKGSAAEILLR